MKLNRNAGFRWIGAALAAASLIVGLAGTASAQSPRPAGVPEAGKSERIDDILKRGTLKVGVTPSFPWLFRNKTGKGDDWRGASGLRPKAPPHPVAAKAQP